MYIKILVRVINWLKLADQQMKIFALNCIHVSGAFCCVRAQDCQHQALNDDRLVK